LLFFPLFIGLMCRNICDSLMLTKHCTGTNKCNIICYKCRSGICWSIQTHSCGTSLDFAGQLSIHCKLRICVKHGESEKGLCSWLQNQCTLEEKKAPRVEIWNTLEWVAKAIMMMICKQGTGAYFVWFYKHSSWETQESYEVSIGRLQYWSSNCQRDHVSLTEVETSYRKLIVFQTILPVLTREWSDPTCRNLPWFFFQCNSTCDKIHCQNSSC
jgi:hypothetical protein